MFYFAFRVLSNIFIQRQFFKVLFSQSLIVLIRILVLFITKNCNLFLLRCLVYLILSPNKTSFIFFYTHWRYMFFKTFFLPLLSFLCFVVLSLYFSFCQDLLYNLFLTWSWFLLTMRLTDAQMSLIKYDSVSYYHSPRLPVPFRFVCSVNSGIFLSTFKKWSIKSMRNAKQELPPPRNTR